MEAETNLAEATDMEADLSEKTKFTLKTIVMNTKIKYYILIIAISILPLFSLAQTDEKLDPEVGGRISLSLNKRIVKGLHVSLEEEIRFDNNFKSFNRFHTTVGLSYKPCEYVKLGIGYAFINPYDSDDKAFKMRHRIIADVTGTVKAGNWSFSLKERLQTTIRTKDYNAYQNPKAAITLKSRFTVKYKGFGKVTPYAYVEIRNYLNAPVISAYYNGSVYFTEDDGVYTESGDAGWFLSSFKGGYLNRVRGSIGIDWRIDKHNTLNFYFMGDYVRDKVIDANKEGTVLKSYTLEKGFMGWFGVGYEFGF